MEKYYTQFENCKQKEEAECMNACPFHFDVLDFQDKIKRHKYDRAYKTYSNGVLFPEIVSRLCPQYCNMVCPRKDFDGAVQLKLLEKACVAGAKKKDTVKYSLPQKGKKIGIIGAGISGLACAVKLLERKYNITIFEKENKIGGQLKELLPEKIYISDVERHLSKEEYELKTDSEIKSLEDLKQYSFDGIYVSTGNGGESFGTSEYPNHCYVNNDVAILGGGSLNGKEPVASIADGIEAAAAIDIFIKIGKLDYYTERGKTKVVPNTGELVKQEPVKPANGEIYTEEEAEAEADRCIRCQCNTCWSHCDMVSFHKKWPIAVREDIITTVASAESMIHKAPAIRLLNTCTQCGVFEKACPANIELGDMILKARKLLHKQNKMPPAYHGFWLDDMEHASGNMSKICRNAPGKSISEYAFFPGCNLGAADTRYVEYTYKWLLDKFDDMGLLLRCCGIHASWAGREDFESEQAASLKRDWEKLGRPTLITACPSCTRYIRCVLPEIEVMSIYELMVKSGKYPANEIESKIKDVTFFVFDPCSSKNDSEIKKNVRTVLEKSGIKTEHSPIDREHGCCGFGGDTDVANPKFTKYVAEKRAALSEKPYITYCINCRDVFIDEKKSVLHILDLLFGVKGFDAQNPDYTTRRNNRRSLKESLLKDVWGEEMQSDEKKYDFDMILDNEIMSKMQKLRLVEDDVKDVIEQSIRMHRRTYDPQSDEYTCYARLNYITCWVSYRMQGEAYCIKNVYTHRMDIKLEEVWNGRKINTDM